MAINIELYNSLVNNTSDFNRNEITVSIPSPTEKDYRRGYITRYFIQRANDQKSVIYEVNSTTFSNLKENPFYKVASLDWVISGDGDKVKELNRKSITYASKDIKYLSLYLPNLLQFWKNS
jgi:hypothetical protein